MSRRDRSACGGSSRIRRRPVDGQGQAIQSAAYLGDGLGVSAVSSKSGYRGPGPRQEQAHEGVVLQVAGVPDGPWRGNRSGGHAELVLAAEPETVRLVTRTTRPGAAREQSGDQRGRPGDLLEVVQDQEEAPGPKVRAEAGDEPVA